jgi:hypothetical protein
VAQGGDARRVLGEADELVDDLGDVHPAAAKNVCSDAGAL